MKTFKNQARQGDIFIKRVPALPTDLAELPREGGRVILAHGEVTGHAHAISSKHVCHFRAAGAMGRAQVDESFPAGPTRAGGSLPAETFLDVKGDVPPGA